MVTRRVAPELAISTNLISNKCELNNCCIKFKCFLQCRGSLHNLFSLPIFSNQTDRKSILLPTAQTAKLQSYDNVPRFTNYAEWNFIRRYPANAGPECLHEIQKFSEPGNVPGYEIQAFHRKAKKLCTSRRCGVFSNNSSRYVEATSGVYLQSCARSGEDISATSQQHWVGWLF